MSRAGLAHDAMPQEALRDTKEALVRGASMPLERALNLELMIAARVAGATA